MNFKTPFKVLTTAALIGTLSLSAVAPGAASAAEKTVTAQAETPANFAIEKVVLVKGDSKISVSFDTYIDALGNEKALNGYELAYVVAANGEVFALDTYVDFYEAGNTEKEVVEKLSKAGKTSEVTEVKDGAFNDGKLEPVEDTAATVKVESVSAIEATIVEVTFPALAEAVTDATVEVKDNTGKVHEVVAQDLAKGATTAQFDFVTPITGDFEGVWTVNGVEYSFDELALVEDIVAAAGANNEVSLNKLLADAGIKNVNVDRISDYLSDITTANSKAPLVWASDVQKVIDATNEKAGEEADEAAVVKAVADATNQVQLLAALEANFDRVNADWIADYATEDVNGQGDMINLDDSNYFDATGGGAVTAEDIQDAIDQVNDDAIYTAVTGFDAKAATAADQVKVTALIEKWYKPDGENQTDKADKIAASKAKEAAFRVAEATTENSLYNALVAYANATPDSVLKASDLDAGLKSYYKGALDATGVKATLVSAIQGGTANIKNTIVTAAETAQLKDAVKAVTDFTALNKTGSPADYTKADKDKALNALNKLASISSAVVAKDINPALISDYIDAIKTDVNKGASGKVNWGTATDVQKAGAIQTLIGEANSGSVSGAITAITSASSADNLLTALKSSTLNLGNVTDANKGVYYAGVVNKTGDEYFKAVTTKAEAQKVVNAGNAFVAANKAATATEARSTLTSFAVIINDDFFKVKEAVDYINLSNQAKLEVAELFLDAKTADYADSYDLAVALHTAMKAHHDAVVAINGGTASDSTPVTGIDADSTISAVDAALSSLGYEAYDNLGDVERLAVAQAFLDALPVDDKGDAVPLTYKTIAEITADIDKAIAKPAVQSAK